MSRNTSFTEPTDDWFQYSAALKKYDCLTFSVVCSSVLRNNYKWKSAFTPLEETRALWVRGMRQNTFHHLWTFLDESISSLFYFFFSPNQIRHVCHPYLIFFVFLQSTSNLRKQMLQDAECWWPELLFFSFGNTVKEIPTEIRSSMKQTSPPVMWHL